MHVFPLCAAATTSGYSILMILAVLVVGVLYIPMTLGD